jgi:hypothetical protein
VLKLIACGLSNAEIGAQVFAYACGLVEPGTAIPDS